MADRDMNVQTVSGHYVFKHVCIQGQLTGRPRYKATLMIWAKLADILVTVVVRSWRMRNS